jgi:hypothetical protein
VLLGRGAVGRRLEGISTPRIRAFECEPWLASDAGCTGVSFQSGYPKRHLAKTLRYSRLSNDSRKCPMFHEQVRKGPTSFLEAAVR